MKKNPLIAATMLSFTAIAGAQSASQSAGQSVAKPSAYGNAYQTPYQGVSQPSNEPILADQAIEAAASQAATPSNATPPVSAIPVSAVPVYAIQGPAIPAQSAVTVPQMPQNPDAGIVETPVPDSASAAAESRPMLRTHSADPDAGIVTEVPDSPNQIPQGTPLHARLDQDLLGDEVTAGTPFTARLTQDVVHMGAVVIPAGSYIHGRVAYVNEGRRISGQSSMKLRPEEVVLPDGTHYFFRGTVTQTSGSNTRANAEGEIVAKGHPIRTAAEYGMTAGSGAVIGGVVAGPVGAVAGAGIGAGLMTVHLLRDRNAPVLSAGSGVTFALSSPIFLTPATTTNSSLPSTPVSTATTTQTSTYVEPKIQN